jgi:transposase
MDRVNCELLKIPPGSPDLNPIENIFKLVSDALCKQAIRSQITKETYKKFKNRVSTIQSLPLEVINNTIASMPNRVKEIIKRKGQ